VNVWQGKQYSLVLNTLLKANHIHMFFHDTCLSISLNHGFPMARVYFIPTISTQPDPEIYIYWKYKYDLINSQKMLWKMSDIHTTLHTITYFILCTVNQHGSDRSRMRGIYTWMHRSYSTFVCGIVMDRNYAAHTSISLLSVLAQYSCRPKRGAHVQLRQVCWTST